MAQGLPVFPNFSVREPAVDTRWKKWCARLENLLVGLDIKDDKRKRALLLHYAGEEVNEIFDTLPDTSDDYATALDKLNGYFAPKKCTEFEVYKFRQAKQETSEKIDPYHTRLRKLCENCEFADNDKEIKSQIIQGCSSTRLRRKALREELSLDDLIKAARALELSESQASQIENSTAETNAVTRRKYKPRKQQQQFVKMEKHRNTKCRNCGNEYPHKNAKCPAEGKLCNYCHKKNHFESVCRSKKRQTKSKTVHNVDNNSSSSDDETGSYLFGLSNLNSMTSRPKIKIKVNDNPINILVDTGSSINVIDERTYKSMKYQPNLSKSDTKVYAYGANEKVSLLGKFQATVETESKMTIAPFYITQGNSGNLLSYQTTVDLQVIPEIRSLEASKVDHLCQKYSEVFSGIGKMADTEIELFIDTKVQPVTQPHRRIPFHLRKQVETELQRLEDLDIIERVDGPTDWVSPIVVAPKPKSKTNEIRICVDMRLPNQAIKRTRHIIPTIDDVIVDLNGARVFSKLDLRNGYHQLMLAPGKSRNVTTFTTHVGLRRYKRLNFGINSAAEIFQNTITTALEGLEGVRNISDDIIVYGRNQTEHDERLEAVLKRLKDKNLTLNKGKCEFNQQKLEFFGYVFGENGMSADPKKCEVIKNAPPPTNVSEVRSYLAMTNYVSRFIPHYSTITEPLRALLKKRATWQWSQKQQDAFDQLKSALSSDTVMTYFDPNRKTEIIVDASPVGLAGIMLQEGKVVCYASKSLTETEKRYSQTEKENLAIVWAIEHWHIYLFGHKFTLISDAKALENIYGNPKSKPPMRLERWRLRLQAYDFDVHYKPGHLNMSDYISRHPSKTSSGDCQSSKIAEEYVAFIVSHDVPKAMTLREIALETSKDNDLQKVIQSVNTGTWTNCYGENSTIDTLARCKNELTVFKHENGELLLHETRIVIPKSLQKKVISIAHEGHQGIVRTKQLLREKVYFPNIDKLVEETCKSCIPCLAATPSYIPEPLQMSKMPDNVFDEVSLDFSGPWPDGKYVMVLMDEYSRFPIVEILNSINAKTVIPILDKIFSEYGVPKTLKSDNGPPMSSHSFTQFADYLGFCHRKITPRHPESNAQCERFMRSLGKAIRASHTQNTCWRQDMYAFLRNYRATIHPSTKQPPCVLFYGRATNIKIPSLPIKTKAKNSHAKAKICDKKAKTKMKDYADSRRNARPSKLQNGDTVLVQQDKTNKFTTPFDPRPYEIIKKKGSMVTAKREDREVTRNSSHFKSVLNPPELPGTDDTEDMVIKEKPDVECTNGQNSEDTDMPRRSTRNRRPPAYLKDYVCE